MSIYNGTGLGYGCNSTAFVQNSSICTQLGGSWESNRKWCSADSLEQVKKMENNALNMNVISLCKDSSAKRLAFNNLFVAFAFALLTTFFLGTFPTAQAASLSQNSTLQPQAQPCQTRVDRVGDGNPHPSCRWKQVTGNLRCDGGSCSTSHLESRTLSYGFGGSGGKFGTAGFDVSESYTTGNTYTCNAGAGQTVCVTALVEYTDYTVEENIYGGNCAGGHYHTPYVIYAPNVNGQQKYRCHRDANCHDLDWERWNHDGKTCDQS